MVSACRNVGRLNITFDTQPYGRLMDPFVLARVDSNVSAPAADIDLFEDAWAVAHKYRERAHGASHNSTEWEGQWHALRSAASISLRMAPLRATSCTDVERCVGVAADGTCACYAGARAQYAHEIV